MQLSYFPKKKQITLKFLLLWDENNKPIISTENNHFQQWDKFSYPRIFRSQRWEARSTDGNDKGTYQYVT